MAFPAVEAINPTSDNSAGGAATSGSTVATSHSVVLPATVSPGALLVVFGRVCGAGTVSVTGGGWTITQDSSDGADDVTFFMWRDTLADGTEGGTSITVEHGNFRMAAVSLSITGAPDPTQPPESSTVAVGTSTTPDPTTCTPAGGAQDYLWLWAGAWDGEQTLSKSPPTNFTDRPDVSTGTAGATTSNCQLKCCDRQLNASSLDAGSITLSVSPAGWTAWLWAVSPRPPAPISPAAFMPSGPALGPTVTLLPL